VAPDDAALAGLARLDEPLPESAAAASATLALLDEAGSPATVAIAGGRYLGFVTGGSRPVALGAARLATAWDQNAALPVMSPVAARLHEVVTRRLISLFGLPAGSAAVFVTGAAGYLPPGGRVRGNAPHPSGLPAGAPGRGAGGARALGRQGAADLVARTCRHAQTMASSLRDAGLEVLNEVVLNQVLVRAPTDRLTLDLVAAVHGDGTCWCGPTTWQSRPAMRISICGWATSGHDVEASADAIVAACRHVRAHRRR